MRPSELQVRLFGKVGGLCMGDSAVCWRGSLPGSTAVQCAPYSACTQLLGGLRQKKGGTVGMVLCSTKTAPYRKSVPAMWHTRAGAVPVRLMQLAKASAARHAAGYCQASGLNTAYSQS